MRAVSGRVAGLCCIGFLAAWPCFSERSALYPEEWTPAYSDAQGHFLHDFSYAGYHNGETPLPTDLTGPVFDVVTGYGADNTAATDATAAIQAAIDAAEAAGGGIVYIPDGLYRCDGRLTVTASNVTISGNGPDVSRIYFTSYAGMDNRAHITFTGSVHRGADIPLAADGENRSTTVRVNDASALHPGDEVAVGWVISDAFVAEHGMTDTWYVFNGQWKPFFRRTVVAVDLTADPDIVTLDVPLRYPAKTRDSASLRTETGYISEVAVVNLGLSNAVDNARAWEHHQVHVLSFIDVKDSFIRNVQSFASPLANTKNRHLQCSGIEVSGSKRVTVRDCQLELAQNRGSGGDGYLFEVRYSSEVLFQDCTGIKGRHNFIQNWDFGATGIVWQRCHSSGSAIVTMMGTSEIPFPAFSEYHHSLATACLVDSCLLEDGWSAGNREDESSGAGHCATQDVIWNASGNNTGIIRSFNFADGYVIGTQGISLFVEDDVAYGNLDLGTEPVDYTEAINAGASLAPQSLYEDQLSRRMGGLVETRVHWVDAETIVVPESVGQVRIPIATDGPAKTTFSVEAVVEPGETTAAPEDYAISDPQVVWASGGAANQDAVLTIVDDNDTEPDETVVLRLANPSDTVRLAEPSTVMVKILDDDQHLVPVIRGPGIATVGEEVVLTVEAPGLTGTLSYTWTRDGKVIQEGDAAVLTLNNVDKEAEGYYQVTIIAQSKAIYTSESFYLDILPALPVSGPVSCALIAVLIVLTVMTRRRVALAKVRLVKHPLQQRNIRRLP